MNSDQLLAIDAALIKAVRKNIKYSTNLYFLATYEIESFFINRGEKLSSIREQRDPVSGFLKGANAASAYPYF
ncbi:hypothetical protein [Piscirickettsia salmonis]|uniref:hypothetical protein n=1 Tax=Piscirickettsia salmonis TaxID=1238 RepID=UPI0007C97519|nr:hypothetical protein A0O36_01781 [Piscirickettsiaceae bacterium NZ-RLO1]